MIKSTIIGTELTLNNLYKRTTALDIFAFYIAGFKNIDEKFCSELRADKRPTCQVGIRNGKKYVYSDFADVTGLDCIDYVRHKFNIGFIQALSRINLDMGLGLAIPCNCPIGKKPVIAFNTFNRKVGSAAEDGRRELKIRIKKRSLELYDLDFWSQYCINEGILQKFNTCPVSYFWLEGENYTKRVKATKTNPTYAYRFGKEMYKLYSPYCKGTNGKWWSNIGSNVIQGLNQVPVKGDLLVITKSMKDIMTLYSFGVTAIAPQAEGNLLPPSLIEDIKSRFTVVVSNYDYDRTGILGANRLKKEFGIPAFMFTNGKWGTKDMGAKDFSDFVSTFGPDKAKEVLEFIYGSYIKK